MEGESLSTLTQCSEKKISQREVKLVSRTVCDAAYTGREFTEEIAFSTKIYLASIESMWRYLVLVLFSKQNQGEKSEEQASPFDKKIQRSYASVYFLNLEAVKWCSLPAHSVHIALVEGSVAKVVCEAAAPLYIVPMTSLQVLQKILQVFHLIGSEFLFNNPPV